VILPISLTLPIIEELIPISKLVDDIFNLFLSTDKRRLFKIGNVKFLPIIFSVIFNACFKFFETNNIHDF